MNIHVVREREGGEKEEERKGGRIRKCSQLDIRYRPRDNDWTHMYIHTYLDNAKHMQTMCTLTHYLTD